MLRWNQSFMEFLKCKDSSTLRKAKTPEGVLLFSVIADKDVAVNDFASQLLRYVVRGPVALILNEGEVRGCGIVLKRCDMLLNLNTF